MNLKIMLALVARGHLAGGVAHPPEHLHAHGSKFAPPHEGAVHPQDP